MSKGWSHRLALRQGKAVLDVRRRELVLCVLRRPSLGMGRGKGQAGHLSLALDPTLQHCWHLC